MEVASGSKPPKNLSKQKSCGQLLHHGKYDIVNRYNRGSVTPNPKTASYRSVQRSESATSKMELKRPLKCSSTENLKSKSRSNLRKTPRSCKGVLVGNTPRSTPVGTKSPMGTHKGKIKRDFEKDNIRPKKRLAIAYSEEDTYRQNDTDKDHQLDGFNCNLGGSGLIPIAEVKPLQIVGKMSFDSQCDDSDGEMIDGVSVANHKADRSQLHHSNHEGNKYLARNIDSGDFSVYVAVRVRPLNKREEQNREIHCSVEVYDKSIHVTERNGNIHKFTYDMAFSSVNFQHPSYASQAKVYAASAEPLLDGVLKGYNTCLFAYGQTGSGKSYTMTGYEGEDAGIIPRFCKELFQKIHSKQITKFTAEISFFEIYNEKIRDLLSYSEDNTKQLRIREHPEQGPYVQDLSIFTVVCWQDIEGWLAVGNKNRATAATGMNDRSSRSHSVFTIMLNQFETELYEGTETQFKRTSKVNLIDLAGSERASQVINEDTAADQETISCRLKEGSCINRSLHTLGKVISLLSEIHVDSKKKLFIPYRESTLTWLLKESLGGNSRTAMIATVSPANIHISETLSTLRYARQARNIVNQVRVNEDANAKMIKELLREIDRLKSAKSDDFSNECIQPEKAEVEMLKERLLEANSKLAEATREWEVKLKLSEERWREETEKIKKSGLASKIDNTLPSLVNLNEDPMLSEVLVYVLKNGHTTFGNSLSQLEHDIKLNGPLVADDHCCITNDDDDVKIAPSGDSTVYVNGEQITSDVVLKHGDRIVIGGTHFFRFNHPTTNCKDSSKDFASVDKRPVRKPSKRELRKKWDGLTLKDFEFAKRELTQQQNAKLQAELEDCQVKAQEGLIELITNAKETAEKQLSFQKEAYKEEISELQTRLEEAECKRRIAEKNRNMAEDRLIQLKSHQQALEEEIQNNRKRLQEEATIARKAFEETRTSQLQIIAELEAEKQKIEEDVKDVKRRKFQRNLVRNEIRSAMASANGEKTTGKKDLLKIALLLREANKISEKLKKNIMFSRDDILDDNEVEIRIRLNDTKNGRTTLWSLGKFELMVARMRDLYQANGRLDEGEEDPFYEAMDEWMDDFVLDSPTIPDSSLNSSRMSIGRRQSLNHSLHLLTNLNASLSELSKRRKSSFACNGVQAGSERRQEQLVSLTAVYDAVNVNSSDDIGGPVCKQLSTRLREINDKMEILSKGGMSCTRKKHLLDVAALLTGLKECANVWERMQGAVKHSSVVKTEIKCLNDSIKNLILAFKFHFQPLTEGQSTEDISDALMKVLSCVGKLSLVAMDYIEKQADSPLCPMQDFLFYKSFVKGQQDMWLTIVRGWSDEIDILLQKLRSLQLTCKENIDLDLDHIVNLLNSSLTLFACIKEFFAFWYENLLIEDPARLLSENAVHSQRHLIGLSLVIINKLRCLVSAARTVKINNDEDLKPIHDQLHCILQNCVSLRHSVANLVSEDRIQNGENTKDKYDKVQFASKAVQVGVAIISQNLDELCFPAGRYSICLESNDSDVSPEKTLISPYYTQCNEDWLLEET